MAWGMGGGGFGYLPSGPASREAAAAYIGGLIDAPLVWLCELTQSTLTRPSLSSIRPASARII
jgi:hypothetical protein